MLRFEVIYTDMRELKEIMMDLLQKRKEITKITSERCWCYSSSENGISNINLKLTKQNIYRCIVFEHLDEDCDG